MLGLRFQIGVGSVIENTQIVFINESLNDLTPGVSIMTTPHVVVSIEVTHDQVWQISGGEVVFASVHYTDMKPLVNSYIQKLVQTKWEVAVQGRYLYLVKPTLGPPKKFQHLTRAKEVVITRLRIGHTKATESHILSRGPPTACHHCGQTLTIDHMLLECAVVTGMSWWILHSCLIECSWVICSENESNSETHLLV